MDPVSLGLAIIAAMWTLDNDKAQNMIIKDQQAKIEQMDNMLLKLAGAHSAVSARDATNDYVLQKEVEMLRNRYEYLDDKIDIYHDNAPLVE